MNAFMPLQAFIYNLASAGGRAKKKVKGWFEDNKEPLEAIAESAAKKPYSYGNVDKLGMKSQYKDVSGSPMGLQGLLSVAKAIEGKPGKRRQLTPATMKGLLGG